MPDDPKFPRGQLNETDEGETPMLIGVEADVVIIRFAKPIAWIGMPAEMAEQLAAMLLERATQARRNRH
jgi:hypothetical protein